MICANLGATVIPIIELIVIILIASATSETSTTELFFAIATTIIPAVILVFVMLDTFTSFSSVAVLQQLLFVFLLQLRFDFLFVHNDLLFGFQKQCFLIHFSLLAFKLTRSCILKAHIEV